MYQNPEMFKIAAKIGRMAPILSAMLYQSGTIDQMRMMSDNLVKAGVENIYFPDHLIGGGHANEITKIPWLAMFPTMLDIGLRHPNIKVGCLVASPLLRRCAQLISDSSTTAHILGPDRFVLTIGAGGAKSDQRILEENMTMDELAINYHQYATDARKLLVQPSESLLRLPETEFEFRLASDSLKSIDTVAELGDGWVTSGGWNSDLKSRVLRINSLYERLSSKGFKGKVSILSDPQDGISSEPNSQTNEDFISHFQFQVDELIFTASTKNFLYE